MTANLKYHALAEGTAETVVDNSHAPVGAKKVAKKVTQKGPEKVPSGE